MNRTFSLITFLIVFSSGLLCQNPQFVIDQSLSDSLGDISDGVVDWIDLDLDEDLDVFLCGESDGNPVLSIFRNDSGSFSKQSTGISPLLKPAIAWGDFDNDADPDLFMMGALKNGVYYEAYSNLYINDGFGNFTLIDADIPSMYDGSASWVDYDNDGDLDLFACGAYSQDTIGYFPFAKSELIENLGNGIFQSVSANFQGVYDGTASWADYDNDMDHDLLLNGHYYDEWGFYTRYTRIYRNDGNNIFIELELGLPLLMFADADWGDYDNDGDLDIILNGNPPTPTHMTYVFKNLGNGSFFDVGIEILGTTNGTIDWGDYDNDGDLDFIQTGFLEVGQPELITFIYKNFGNDMFTIDGSVVIQGVYYSSTAWGDYDNDNDLDLIISGYSDLIMSSPLTLVYENRSSSINTIPGSPYELSAQPDIGKVALEWQAAFDNETGSLGLSYNLMLGKADNYSSVCSPMSLPEGFRMIIETGNSGSNNNWMINGLEPGTYYWSVQSIDHCYKGSDFSDIQMFEILPLSNEEKFTDMNTAFSISCYPVPFMDYTYISLISKDKSYYAMEIYNASGNLIYTLFEGILESGENKYVFDRNSVSDNDMPPGNYYLKVSNHAKTEVLKIIAL